MLKTFDHEDTLASGAAALFVELAQTAVAARGRFAVALSGGETPRRTYQLLAQEPYRSQVPWDGVHLFWSDERCVPRTDPRSNALMTQVALLSHVPLPRQNIHPIHCNGSAQQAADAYATELAGFFKGSAPRFDLVLLGLGDDGHTASLLPESSALQETVRWTAVAKRPEESFSRVTLTAPILNQAAVTLFLVSGEGKAVMLKNIMQGHDAPRPYPAQLIRPLSGDVRWFVDQRAASRLTMKASTSAV